MPEIRSALALCVALSAFANTAGCGSEAGPAPTGQDEADATENPLLDGTPDAVGVFTFLNDAATTFAVLDDDARLDRRAAANLVAHRDGPDAEAGTADDETFDTVAEVDDVSWVGPSTLNRLAAYARENGWVPEGDELLGTYDEVPFSVNEAEAVLELVNAADEARLDVEVGLDRRAVDSILEARPVATVLGLSELYYVGASALLKLKAHAGQTIAGAEGSDCAANDDCDAGLSCTGIPYDGAPEIGKCVDNSSIPGEELQCSESEACQSDLFCSGMTVYGGNGYCRKMWMQGTYESHEEIAIPDGDGAIATSDVVVYGQATVPEDIVVTLDLDHPRPEDLVIRLISTNGSDSMLWDHDPNAGRETNPALGIERDNYINGTFTLEIVDTVAGESGTLHGVSLWVSSRYD